MRFLQNKWIGVGCVLACLFLTAIPPPARGEPPPAEPLAVVDENPITVAAFQARLARLSVQNTTLQQKTALLEEMVRFELLYAAARKAGYDQDPAILESLKRIMAAKYRKDVLEPRFETITVSEQQVEQYYQDHQADFVTPKRVRAAVIRISISDHASTAKKAELLKRAEAARAEALDLGPATPSFGPVAVRYSDHQPTRYRGGDAGWLQPDRGDRRWPEAVTAVVFSLQETGQVSPVITTPSGYYLVRLMATQESALRPYAAVKEHIRHQLLARKKAEVEQDFYEELKGKLPVRVDRARLEAVEAPETGGDHAAKQPPALPGQ